MENEKYFYLAYPLLLFHEQWMKYLQKKHRRWNGKKLIIEKNIVIMLGIQNKKPNWNVILKEEGYHVKVFQS